MKKKILLLTFAFLSAASFAQGEPAQTLFTNVNVFDGVSEARIENANVLVEGNLIKAVSIEPIQA